MHKNKWFSSNLAEKEAAVMAKVGTYAICNFLSFFFPLLHVICRPWHKYRYTHMYVLSFPV